MSMLTGLGAKDDTAVAQTDDVWVQAVQVWPILWALVISFGAVIDLNSYLADIPARISKQCDTGVLSIHERNAFAAEYSRLGLCLEAPVLGRMTTQGRNAALISFATAFAAAAWEELKAA